jgi:ribosomal-protein-alanine N-acetyltransferase
LTIRLIESRDIESILAIQADCPEIAQWSAWDYERVARGEMTGWICEEDLILAGFLVARRVDVGLEILNFAVRPGARLKGMGSALLRQAIEWSELFAAEHVFLEVRSSNLTALRFYQTHNFQVTGTRPGYYAAPIESAILLTASVEQVRL